MNPKKILKSEGQGVLVFCFLTISVFAVSLLFSGCFSQKKAIQNKPVLVINDVEISAQQFADRLARKLRNYDAIHIKDEANLSRAKEEIINVFVLEIIAKQFATKSKIEVSSTELEAKVKEIRGQYPDDFAFRRALADERLSYETWREDLEFTILQKKIFEKITASQVEPAESEMKAYFEANKAEFQRAARVRLRQIVLEKEEDAKRIMDDLTKGSDLAKLATSFSVAPEASKGGDTGWLDKGTLEIFDQAFKMPVGARSKILKSPYGYHIYEVLGKEPEARLSFTEARAKIRSILLQQRDQKLFTSWLEEQVRKSRVTRNDALIQSIKITTRGS